MARAGPVKSLEAGSVYVTVSLPCSYSSSTAMPIYGRKRKAACGVDIATYETHCAQGLAQEEFSWGLYFHRGRQDGIWLELRPNHNYAVEDNGDDDDSECRPRPTPFKLHRHRLSASPRLHCRVVGIIRVLCVPCILCDELTWYLDWLALESYGTASRTFIWATSMYLRTWHHIVQMLNNPMPAYGAQFDVNLFLREALRFSYENADYSIGGQLPRPIITSAYGTELDLLDETNVKQRLMLAQQHVLAQPGSVQGSSESDRNCRFLHDEVARHFGVE
ncbi:hypothetical protein E4U36_004740 [Claviceps purpurea]|nr:hypothetical protein E4U36_004740 [Claviceps purpurea]KAG6305329.1 hypothetical protein E4U45_000482 [Claviceps purpurea]